MASSHEKPRTSRNIAVTLCWREADEADRLTDILRRGGWPKANRSLVAREALFRLQEELVGRPPAEIFQYFADRHAQRAESPDTVHETREAGYEPARGLPSEAADIDRGPSRNPRDER